MPGLNFNSQSIRVVQHNSAGDFLSVAYPTLRRHERSSNIILAHALKRISTEAALTGCQFITDSEVYPNSPSTSQNYDDSFWLTVWSTSATGSAPTLDLILSCTTNTLGDYPVFLWTPYTSSSKSATWLVPRITALIHHLLTRVHPERVFSVFGLTSLVKTFAKHWSDITGFVVEPEPFYAAYFTFCTPDTFQESAYQLSKGHVLRRATLADVDSVAQLCKEFADDSIYFPLTIDRAKVEACEMISKGQIWVYEASNDIAAICAVTRSSVDVSAITKVYTTPKWRRRGFAEHLVRYVTRRLFDCGKESVVLYVGHANSAQRVYDRVGFVGLCGKSKPEGVEDSLELGFVGSKRGHW
ncbi:hypothetical protein SERLA73DRAFT_161345 [Serpula lacrymans var. lacrymans S7.3]|uniref:N-acetyltransferase domain-containing protein n=2 Tax=Serpula lacrymans var. lacrymans TaxID=341189 RepID=F8Q1V4_SERL3|nr:uncharacterized protein SERLADRAFT_356808 [Serpula lacrymans var. lacrymans S7.9]EGN97165.1 hypothetical protein SERLA73DRAFT_161345 [Serpula lacrymans var. lacrymans S7.3]EGO22773.1 hypothetical protein SERLADRAFT_356808 [Serpula lacrymans var. lacrymans S7.9]